MLRVYKQPITEMLINRKAIGDFTRFVRDELMSLLCVPLIGNSPRELLQAARTRDARNAELIELRLDGIRGLTAQHIEQLKRGLGSRPAIATLRPSAEGGSFSGSEAKRATLLENIIKCEFKYIDLELSIPRNRLAGLVKLCQKRGVKCIVSHHDRSRTPSVARIFHMMKDCAAAGDIAKVAFAANSVMDTLRLIKAVKLVRKKVPRFIAIGMGGPGRLTRTLAPFLGSEIVYASLDPKRRTAPGQLTVGELKALWAASGIDADTSPATGLYGLLGHPLGHSMSPLMHNTAFRALRINAAYMPFEVPKESLKGTVQILREIGLRGANVTIPHKEAIIPLLDGLDAPARAIGAVNTLVNKNGRLIGYNTDAIGFIGALKAAGVRLKGSSALILGAGGAARAAVYGLLGAGAHVAVANRTRKRALGLKRHLQARSIDVIDLKAASNIMAHTDLLVNCTPVGMSGFLAKSPVPSKHLHSGLAVLDMVYNPVRTPLLALAQKKGALTIPGMEMFIRQGMESFRLWTGKSMPLDTIQRSLLRSMSER